MPLEKDFLSPITLLSRAGTTGDPFIKKTETNKKVDINGMVQLQEIPAKFTRNYIITEANGDLAEPVPVIVSVLGNVLTEVKDDTKNVAFGQYRVDYENGLIFLNPQYYAGATLNYVQYTGRGAYFISANRIYLGFADDLSSIQTLESQVQDAYNLISTAGAYISPENRGALAADISLSTILATANLKEWNYWIATTEITLTLNDVGNSVIDFDNTEYVNGQTVILKENSWLVRTVGNRFQIMQFGAPDEVFSEAAVDITYSNTISGLLATNAQEAIDEVKSKVDSVKTTADAAAALAAVADGKVDAAKIVADKAQEDIDLHKANNGSDHSFINQDIKNTASPAFNALKYNTVGAPTHTGGQVWYDGKTLWLDTPTPQMRIPLGQGEFRFVRNETGSTITALSVIYPNGSSQGLSTVDLADARYEEKVKMIGVTLFDIPNNSNGWVVTSGGISGIDTSAFGVNDFLYVSDVTPGLLTTEMPTDGGAYEVLVAKVRDSDLVNGAIGIFIRIAHSTQETHNVNGFPPEHQIDVTLSANPVTREFSLTPDNARNEYHFYVAGIKYVKTSTQTVIWPNVTGQHYILHNSVGDLIVLTNPTEDVLGAAFQEECAVAFINWNATTQKINGGIADERHGMDMPPSVHGYNHRFFGSQYLEGMGLGDYIIGGNGDLDSSAQVSISGGVFYDEDIRHELLEKTLLQEIDIFYNTGSESEPILNVKKSAPGFINTSFNGTGRAEYNRLQGGVWDLAEVPNKDFVLAHVFATNFIDENNIAKKKYAVMMGREFYILKADARIGANVEIFNLRSRLPFPEMIAVATFILETNTSYDNASSSRFVQTDNGGDFIDWIVTSAPGQTGSSVSSHASLLNLDAINSHPASAISFASANFTAINVSQALEENFTNIETHKADVTNPHAVDFTDTGAVGLTTNQTIAGQKTFTDQNTYFKDIHVQSIFQEGATYETHAEQLYTTKDEIILREGALGGLNVAQYTGLRAKLYDGVNDGLLVFDKDGIARVGDEGSLVPLLARDEQANLTNNDILTWDSAGLIAKGKTTVELGLVHIATTETITGTKTFTQPVTHQNAFPEIYKNSGYKSWAIHRPSHNGLIIAPSSTVDGVDWNWSKQIIFSDLGGIAATGNVTAPNLKTANWDTAYGWGDHSLAGYLTASAGGYNNTNWDTAYSWGNHAGLYLGLNSKAKDSDKLDGYDSTSFIKFGETLMPTNPFGGKKLYINSIDNALHAANKRFVVTATRHLRDDGINIYPMLNPDYVATYTFSVVGSDYTITSPVATPPSVVVFEGTTLKYETTHYTYNNTTGVVTLLYTPTGTITINPDFNTTQYLDGPVQGTASTSTYFDGNYDGGQPVAFGEYIKIRIMGDSDGHTTFGGYPYGDYYISHYYTGTPEKEEYRVYNYSYFGHGIGWKKFDMLDYIGDKSNSGYISSRSDGGNYGRTVLEFIVYGRDTSDGKNTTSITQIDHKKSRPYLSRDGSTVTKYGNQELHYDFNWKNGVPKVDGLEVYHPGNLPSLSTLGYTGDTDAQKNPTSHAISFITGLQSALDGKVDDNQVLTNVPAGALFTDTDTIYTHPASHTIAFITGLQDALDSKENNHTHPYLSDTHPAKDVTAQRITNWDTAFSWGNHATPGYLVATALSYKNTNWDAAFGWGDHSLIGYSLEHTHPYLSDTHPAKDVTVQRIIDWDTAFGWGNHSTQGYAKAIRDTFTEMLVTNETVDVVSLTIDAMVGTTANLQEWKVNGTLMARIGNNGNFYGVGVSNPNFRNSLVSLLDTGTKISRDIADANAALVVNQVNAASTGNLQEWKKAGTTVARINNDGIILGTSFYDIDNPVYYLNPADAGISLNVAGTIKTSNISIDWGADAYGIAIDGPTATPWARGYHIKLDGTTIGGLGGFSDGVDTTNYYLGRAYDDTDIMILSNGNVGIGTSTPSEKLEVAGNIKATGTVTGSNLNVASWNTAFGWGDHEGLYLTVGLKGTVNGLAELDENGLVPASQLPSYVDDVIEGATTASFPVTGEAGKIYVAVDTNITYRWSGSVYVEISSSLALGTTSSTAYRGDHGLVAYNHSQVTTGNPHAISFSDLSGTNPTTLSGYGITDAFTETEINNFFAGTTAKTGYNKTNWDLAFGWGNHATPGYLVATALSYNNSDWDLAFGWGDHSVPGYLTTQISHDDVVVDADVTEAATASKIVKRDASGDININNKVQATSFSMEYDGVSKSIKFKFA